MQQLRLSTTRLSLALLLVAVVSLLSTLYYASQLLQQDSATTLPLSKENTAAAAALYSKKLRLLQAENKRLRSQLVASTAAASKEWKQLAEEPSTERQQQPGSTHHDINLHLNLNDPAADDTCQTAFIRATRHQTPGLTKDSIRRSRANWGHAYRLDQFAHTLFKRNSPLQVVAFGGSITAAHGVVKNITHVGSESYTALLEYWLNQEYPIAADANATKKQQQQQQQQRQQQHRVYNMAQHGADMCSLAKRMTSMLSYLQNTHNVQQPDMVLLEYAVNDYQGQDHVNDAVSQLDVFFQGYQDIALCAEVVVYKLLTTFPKTAVMFVEFRTGILERKTAQMLHMGVAQHYQVPVISYADAIFPEFFELVYEKLSPNDRYTVPIDGNDTLLPFPYGCHDCQPETIIDQFRYSFNPKGIKECRTVCDLAMYAGLPCDHLAPPPRGRKYCYPALLAVDAVHPSARGHHMAKDLIVHAIATAIEERCERQHADSESLRPQPLPPVGWLGTPRALQSRSNFVLVKDADCAAQFCRELLPTRHSPGFSLYSDTAGNEKRGWIATNSSGGEWIEFDIDLPKRPCYVVYLAMLRSYVGMGMMQVTVVDRNTGNEMSVELDSLWQAKISVWSDNQITSDDIPGCTGQCVVRVQTLPQPENRTGNKVKILTLSVRECIRL